MPRDRLDGVSGKDNNARLKGRINMNSRRPVFHQLQFVALLALVLAASSCEQDAQQKSQPPYDNLLKEQFDDATFPAAGWTIIGPGTIVQDMNFGEPSPSLRLDSSGAQSGLISPPFVATAHFSVKIAIDPTPNSGASATLELRNATTMALVASVTVEETQITYVMGTATPIVQAWTADGAFHEFEFQSSSSSISGGHWWIRDSAQAAGSSVPNTATEMTMNLIGPSSGDAWFDDVWVHHHLIYPN